MKIILNLFIALLFIGYGSLASASDEECVTLPTGIVCCVPAGGVDVCTPEMPTDPAPLPG